MKPRCLIIAAAIPLVLFSGCKSDNARQRALSEWKRHEASVERAIRGQFVVEEFQESTLFFAKLTGISIRGNGTPFGFLPDQYTAQDFEKVKEWCRRNCDRLYWDEKSHSVFVKD